MAAAFVIVGILLCATPVLAGLGAYFWVQRPSERAVRHTGPNAYLLVSSPEQIEIAFWEAEDDARWARDWPRPGLATSMERERRSRARWARQGFSEEPARFPTDPVDFW